VWCAVVRVDRKRCGEARDLVQAREQGIHKNVWRAPAGYSRDVGVEGRHQPRELQLIQVDVVIKSTETCANYRLFSNRTPCHAYPWREVVPVGSDDSSWNKPLLRVVEPIQRRWNKRRKFVECDKTCRRIEIAFLILLLFPRSPVFISHAEVQRQPLIYSPV